MKSHFLRITVCFFLLSLFPLKNIQAQDELTGEYLWQILENTAEQENPDAIQLYEAALAAMMSGQSALADLFFQKLDKTDKAIAGKNFWHALALVDLQRNEEALALLRRHGGHNSPVEHLAQNLLAALQNQPPLHQDTQAMLIYARGRMATGDYPLAVDVLEGIIQEKGNIYIPYALFYQGQNYSLMHRNADAAGRYRLLTSLYPQSPMATAANFALAQIAPDEQQEALLQSISSDSYPSAERLAVRVELGMRAANDKDEKALLALVNMRSTKQEKERLSYIQSVYYAYDNQMDKAISILEQIQNSTEETGRQARYARAFYLFKQKDFIGAKDNLKDYLSSSLNDDNQNQKTWTDSDMLYLAALRASNKASDMQEFLGTLPIEQAPGADWLAYYYLCKSWTAIENSDPNQAIVDSNMALNISADMQVKSEANYYMALAYARRAEYVRAEEYFAQAQTNADAHELEFLQQARALAAFRSKQIDKARQLSSAYEYSSLDFWQILQAAIYTSMGQFSRSAQIYDDLAARSDFTHSRDARYLAALNHYRAGNKAAAQMFTSIINDNQEPDGNKTAYFWLGKSYEQQKNWSAAIENYQLSLSIRQANNRDILRKDTTDGEATSAMLSAMLKSNDNRLMPMLRQMRNSNPDLVDQTAYTLAEEAAAAQKYSLALELFNEIQNKEFKMISLYSQASNLEAMGEYVPALNTYLSYIKEDSSSAEALLVSRKIAQLSDTKTLQNLIFGPGKISLSTTTKAPLILAWIEKAGKSQKSKVKKILADLPLQDLDEIERSQVNLVQARFYKKIQDYPLALSSYDTALNLVLSPQQYFQARRERSQIYEKQGDITQAAKEFLLIEQTFRSHPDIAAQALYEAGLLFQRHHMPSQRDVIQKTLKERYPNTPQASRI